MEKLLEGLKKCSRCLKVKTGREFNADAKSPDGMQTYCRECQHEYNHNRNRKKEKERTFDFNNMQSIKDLLIAVKMGCDYGCLSFANIGKVFGLSESYINRIINISGLIHRDENHHPSWKGHKSIDDNTVKIFLAARKEVCEKRKIEGDSQKESIIKEETQLDRIEQKLNEILQWTKIF